MIWAHRNPDKCEFISGVYRSFRVPMPLVKRIAVTGMPLMLNETIWAAGQAFLLQSYSVRGIAVVSAMNITNTLFNTVSVLFMAVGSAIAILLGHLLGDGKLDEARDSARKMIAFSIFMGVATGVIVAALSGLFPHIYNTTEEVRALSTLLILVTAVTSPLRAYVHACYFTIRSGGNTWITFLFDSVFVWCVNVPIAFFLSSFTTMSITLVFFATQAADLAKMLFGIWLLRRGTWAKNITVSSNEEESV
jgi:Na+-driven multidrug efflux pump